MAPRHGSDMPSPAISFTFWGEQADVCTSKPQPCNLRYSSGNRHRSLAKLYSLVDVHKQGTTRVENFLRDGFWLTSMKQSSSTSSMEHCCPCAADWARACCIFSTAVKFSRVWTRAVLGKPTPSNLSRPVHMSTETGTPSFSLHSVAWAFQEVAFSPQSRSFVLACSYSSCNCRSYAGWVSGINIEFTVIHLTTLGL